MSILVYSLGYCRRVFLFYAGNVAAFFQRNTDQDEATKHIVGLAMIILPDNVSCTLVPANEKAMLNELVMKERRALREQNNMDGSKQEYTNAFNNIRVMGCEVHGFAILREGLKYKGLCIYASKRPSKLSQKHIAMLHHAK